jgi:hypothetical protein
VRLAAQEVHTVRAILEEVAAMLLYLLATIGAVTVAVLLWRTFGSEHVGVGSRRSVAPDDDPEFLRKLGEQARRPRKPGDSESNE